LGSGWAQAIAKIYGDMPIHASAWKKDIKLVKNRLKMRIAPHLFQKELSRMKRDEILQNAKKITRLSRREAEKQKETAHKTHSLSISEHTIPEDLQINTQPIEESTEDSRVDHLVREIKEDEFSEPEEVEGFETDWNIVKKESGWNDELLEYLERRKNQ
jgi:hypothetical protein